MPFGKQQAAAPGVGLDNAQLAQFRALHRGFNAIRDRYFELVKEPLTVRITTGSKTEVKEAEAKREVKSAVGKAMNGADRNVDRLVLVHGAEFVADRDFGIAAHDNPMLGTVPVPLQR